ncbi:MAG: hypothetical protein ABII09_07185 [Planctomycetota bacterium]
MRLALPRSYSIITIGLFLFCLIATVSVWLYPDTVFQGYHSAKSEESREKTIIITRVVLLILCLVGAYKASNELMGYPVTVPYDRFHAKISLKGGKSSRIGPLRNLQQRKLFILCRVTAESRKMKSFRISRPEHGTSYKVNLLCVSTKDHEERLLDEKKVTFDKNHHKRLVDFKFGATDEPICLVISASESEQTVLEADIRLSTGMRLEKIFRWIDTLVFTEATTRE